MENKRQREGIYAPGNRNSSNRVKMVMYHYGSSWGVYRGSWGVYRGSWGVMKIRGGLKEVRVVAILIYV